MSKFKTFIDSGYPLIAVKTDDEEHFLNDIIIWKNNIDIYIWDEALGVRFPDDEYYILDDESGLEKFLDKEWVSRECKKKTLLVLRNYTCHQTDKSNYLLRLMAQRHENSKNLSIIIFVQDESLHNYLVPYAVIYKTKNPSIMEIRNIFNDELNRKNDTLCQKMIEEISFALKGLTRYEIKLVLKSLFLVDLQKSSQKEIMEKIKKFKRPFVNKHGFLEVVDECVSLDDVGGFASFKKYAVKKEKIVRNFDDAKSSGLSFPKGVLFVGEPGCGKSLVCKAVATLFKLPLFRLDIGKLLGKYLGESEQNFRNTLSMVESFSPCVLWIDEIEKAFSGGKSSSGGSDVVMRLIGNFLTWLQEKRQVYVVATANDVSSLPVELFRKGRFDEIYYAGYPNALNAVEIFNIHFKKRGYEAKNYQHIIAKEGQLLKNFSGSEIESFVEKIIENWWIDGKTEPLVFYREKFLTQLGTPKINTENRKKALDFGAIDIGS